MPEEPLLLSELQMRLATLWKDLMSIEW